MKKEKKGGVSEVGCVIRRREGAADERFLLPKKIIFKKLSGIRPNLESSFANKNIARIANAVQCHN